MYSETYMRARSSKNSQDVLEKEEGLSLRDDQSRHKAAVIAMCVTKAGVEEQAVAPRSHRDSTWWDEEERL